MKYIKTKDGIFESEKVNIVKRIPLNAEPFYSIEINMGKGLTSIYVDIIAKADTIEELCDEFVLPKFREVFAIDRFSKQVCINHIKCGNGDAFGAIWCEWGLKYVAKLNDRGELELL